MLYPKIPGESAQDRGVRIVRDMAGCSLLKNRDKLTRFVARDGAESKPEDVVQWETNCAEFGVSYLAALAGSLEDARKLCALLALPIRNGQAFSVLVQIGDKLGAWCPAPKKGEPVPRAAIIWYEIDGTNDDHAEISLDPPDEHGGGGRAHNEITIAHGDEHESWSRPIHKILDITKIKFDLPGLAAIARVDGSRSTRRDEAEGRIGRDPDRARRVGGRRLHPGASDRCRARRRRPRACRLRDRASRTRQESAARAEHALGDFRIGEHFAAARAQYAIDVFADAGALDALAQDVELHSERARGLYKVPVRREDSGSHAVDGARATLNDAHDPVLLRLLVDGTPQMKPLDEPIDRSRRRLQRCRRRRDVTLRRKDRIQDLSARVIGSNAHRGAEIGEGHERQLMPVPSHFASLEAAMCADS